MKAVFAVLNSKYVHVSPAPYCLKAGVDAFSQTKNSVTVFEATINEDINAVAKRLVRLKPQLLGVCCYIWNIEKSLELVNIIKKHLPDTLIVLGGPEVSYRAREILTRESSVDFVISGEGEKPAALLLDCLNSGGDKKAVPGLCLRWGRGIHFSGPFIHEEPVPSPYDAGYGEALKGRIAYIESSRGCPFSCAFCLSGRCGSVRFFDMEKTKRDMLTAADSGAATVKFVDRTFNCNKNRTNEILSFIRKNYGRAIKPGVCFHFEIAGDMLCEETFEILSAMPRGAVQFEIGIQSFNEKTLAAVNRKTDTARLEKNIKKLLSMGNAHTHIDLIAGLPFEDAASFRQSFNRAFSLNADMLQLGFLKILHGSPMGEKRRKYPLEYSEKPPYEVVSTPYISENDLKLLHYTENALDRFCNSGRFPHTSNYIFTLCGFEPYVTLTELGMYTGLDSCPLSVYADKLFGYFEKQCESETLRDNLICDYLSTGKEKTLPRSLFREDKRLKQFKKSLEENPVTKRKKGVLRTAAILYGRNKFVYTDHETDENGKNILKFSEITGE